MNGEDYINLLLEMNSKGQTDILRKTIKDNKRFYPIDKNDIDNYGIEGILFFYKLNNDLINMISLQTIKTKTKLYMDDPNNKKIDLYIEYDSNTLLNEEQIRESIKKSISDKINLNLYNYIDNENQKRVNIYNYYCFVTLDKGQYFGDSLQDDNNSFRMSACQANEETHLGVVNYSQYQQHIFLDKFKYLEKEINFLTSNFFFKFISLQAFKKDYFNFFKAQKIGKNVELYNHNDTIKSIYFIKSGIVNAELYLNHLELIEYISQLALLLNVNFEKNQQEVLLKKESENYNLYLEKKHIKVSSIINIVDVVGIEKLFGGCRISL